MIRARAILPSILLLAGLSTGVLADDCRRPATPSRARHASETCGPENRVVPYDPDAVKRGRNPGFIDLGNGTEVRVGGRVRADYDVRR